MLHSRKRIQVAEQQPEITSVIVKLGHVDHGKTTTKRGGLVSRTDS